MNLVGVYFDFSEWSQISFSSISFYGRQVTLDVYNLGDLIPVEQAGRNFGTII